MTGGANDRPVTVLIAALGGEGGGVLTGWVVRAAEIEGLMVQSTSIPGVAQRTGTTTYYTEIFPTPVAELRGREPVLSLYPSVGDIDLMVASELIEAGRAIQMGYVSPDRTTLIASTHRIYAIAERGAMADGRFDAVRIRNAAEKRAMTPLLSDFAALARDNDTSLNAVLLGVIAASGGLPIGREAFIEAIRESGIAVDSNMRGFELGLEHENAEAPAGTDGKRRNAHPAGRAEGRARTEFPQALHEVLIEGVRRLNEYQGTAYAMLYLDRVQALAGAPGADEALARETARLLALWMCYEDVIRVAQIKSHPNRYARVLAEVGAGDGQPVVVTEFFKPGIEEFCSVLPGFLARPILGLGERMGWMDRFHVGLHVKTTSVNGFLRLWLLTKLRGWRPHTYRFKEEQRRIGEWLGLVTAAAASHDPALAIEVAGCARLLKGYGGTYRRGARNYERVVQKVVRPALDGVIPAERAADAVANATAAALADPDGKRLDNVIAAIGAPAQRQAAE